MDEEIERLVVRVRADTGAFAADVAEMRGQLDGPLGAGAERAGRAIEGALTRAVRTGKLGFDDLRRVALATLSEIATSAIGAGIGSLVGGAAGSGAGSGRGKAGGLIAAGTGLLTAALGLPGRATGGQVSPGRAYLVGERGPEVFVPTSSGRIDTGAGRGGREVRVAITLNAPAGTAPEALGRSSRQVARAVRAALDAAER
jgi:phage-related minor tail protein